MCFCFSYKENNGQTLLCQQQTDLAKQSKKLRQMQIDLVFLLMVSTFIKVSQYCKQCTIPSHYVNKLIMMDVNHFLNK